MDLPFQIEAPSEDGWFGFDILLQHPCWGRVGLEVDGPYHFLFSNPKEFHGKAVIRNRSVHAASNRSGTPDRLPPLKQP